jgi:PEP-CTERM motif
MQRTLTRLMISLLAMGLMCAVAHADDIGVGDLSFDAATLSGTSATLDITNLTGDNAFPPDFPITTPVTISVTQVVVDLLGGGTITLPGSDFTVVDPQGDVDCTAAACDLSGDLVTGATLTGTLSPTSGLSGLPAGDTGILAGFSTTISPGGCGDGSDVLETGCDTAIIYATGTTGGGGPTVPEPGTWGLMAIGLVGLLVARRSLRGARAI